MVNTMKKFLFRQDGSFVALIDKDQYDSVIFEDQGQLIEYLVDVSFEFDFNKKYSIVNGELQIEDSPMLPPPEIIEEPLTPQQKLEAAGLTVDDLKKLLGL
jgi:hypothetical protein